MVGHARATRDNRKDAQAETRGDGLCCPVTLDEASVVLGELGMSMRRWFTSSLPHEFSVFIPRAEVRIRRNRGVQETELVLESITIVHAPRPPVKARDSHEQE
ncbi:MAG: hypothetical protein NUW12_11155 [Firmicutes bacterium]|nr:hypothetical protein [Bacillota bacterium]MDH7496545.1 hypothetical protein [Bacillota bacterium]